MTATAPRSIKTGCLVCSGTYRPSQIPGLVECTACDFVSADLDLSEHELETIYGKNYFSGDEYLDYLAEEQSLRLNFRQRWETLRQFAPDLAERHLLELGCAYGFFLDEVRNLVKSATGIDISADAIEFARKNFGVDAHHGDYLTSELEHPFGIVTMWDTIEHLKRPDLFIAKIRQDLQQGGLLALTTGDVGSLNARWRGANWRMIHPPTHLHYFSVKTVTALLERHGFKIIHVSHPGISRKLRSILYYSLVWRTRRTALYDRLKDWRLFDLRINFNMFDIMYVIARRT